MIEIEDLSYAYAPDAVALESVSLRIQKGEFVAVMGQNGAGKTTLVKHFNGLLKPQHGNVVVNGQNTQSCSVAELSRMVGFVFQNANHCLFAETVKDEILFTLRNFGVKTEELAAKTAELLTVFDLLDYQNQSPFSLSGGEQKRLALAAMLCVNPEIVVLDEPTIGQDAHQKEALAALLDQYVANKKTVVVVTHDVEFVAEHIPRTIVMSRGRIIADGPTKLILTHPKITEISAIRRPELTRLCVAIQSRVDAFPDKMVTIPEVHEAFRRFFDLDFSVKPSTIPPTEKKS